MKKLFYFFVLITGIVSCQKENNPGEEEPKNLIERNILDTTYGSDAQQKMDIYLPAGRTKTTKTIILIHGGGWTEGNKSDLTSAIPELQKQFPGYAFININYRLAKDGANLFPTQENDTKSAIALYLQNADNFYVSKNIVLAGFSAGAHLALLHAYKNDPDKNVKAVIDFFGPTQLPALWNANIIYQLLLYGVTGKTYDQDAAIYNNSSPANFVSAQSPPTLILQGDADPTVPPSQSILLSDSLAKHNIGHQLVMYAGEGHGWTGNNLLDSYEKIKAFLKQYVD
ncbi:MAG: alpha/beta hydrolase [Chitinophagaceae bacterium]|nr:alpha/beta hydrolase [Chitinophagaceae bacterium]